MAHLADWRVGSALGDSTRTQVQSCAALAVVIVEGHTLSDYARAGSAMEAVWVAAQQHGLAVHPVSPVFLYARTPEEFRALSAPFAQTIADLRDEFSTLAGIGGEESIALVLRLSSAPASGPRSRRRTTTDEEGGHGSQS